MSFPFEPWLFAVAAATVFASYIVFGISAFGAALFTVPILSHFLPLDFVLPMCVLLDVAAALVLGTRFSRDADRGELKWMVPFSFVGAVLGVTLLVNLPRQAVLAVFGVLLACYSAWTLKQGAAVTMISRRWAPLSGFVGGAFGTLFGIGAPPYAIYLSRRLTDMLAFRATLSNMVIFSVSIRALVFTVGGLMLADRLAGFAVLVPFALAGLWLGNRIQGRVSRASTLRFVSALLVLIGVSLVVRAVS